MKYLLLLLLPLTATAGTYQPYSPPPVIVAQPSSGPYTVYTPGGTYVVVPNATTGQPMVVIQTSKGK